MMERRRRMLDSGIIPPEYQKVDYLESRGSQYIATDVNAKSGLYAKYGVAFTQITSSAQQICAALNNNSNNRIYFPYIDSSGKLCYGYGKQTGTVNDIIVQTNTRYNIEVNLSAGTQEIYINGVLEKTGTDSSDFDVERNLFLFASNNISTSLRRFAYARIYGFEILDLTTRQMLLNYIPCVRKSDSKPGMYDTVSKTFYTNSGSNDFIIPS